MARRITNTFDNLNGLKYEFMSDPISLTNNTTTPTAFASFNTTGVKFLAIDYSATRGTKSRIGKLIVTHDDSQVYISDTFGETDSLGLVISATLVSNTLSLNYTLNDDNNTNASLRFDSKSWS